MRVFFRGGGIELEFHVAALGDFEGGIAGAGNLGEERAHFLCGLEMHLGRVAHPVFIDEQVAGADADHHIVRLVVPAFEEVHIVGGHGFEAEFCGQFQQPRAHPALRFEVVVMDFHVGVFLAVDVHQFGHRFAGFVFITGEQPFIDRTADAAGEADDAFGKLAQHRAVHPRLAVIKAVEVALGDELGEVVPALGVLGQQREVGGALAAGQFLFIRHGERREVDLAAEDRLHALFFAVLVKFDGSVEVSMVGHRHRRHAQLRRPLGQILGADHAVEQGEFGVDVEVDEGIGHGVGENVAAGDVRASLLARDAPDNPPLPIRLTRHPAFPVLLR